MPPAEERPLRLGLVGAGGFGAFLADSLATTTDVAIVAVTDQNAARADRLAARHGTRSAASWQELVTGGGDLGIDGVIVATPPWLHAEIAATALHAGLAVLCEKPLAMSVGDAEEVLRARDERGAALVVDHVLRYTPLPAIVRSLLRGPAGGPVQRVLVENDAADEPLAPDHWFWDRARSGGILVEHAVHFLDLAGDLIGAEPTVVQALGSGPADSERTDTVVANVRYAGGALTTQYHAFAHAARCERQLVRIDAGTFEARLTGWIPWRLDVEAWTDDAGVGAVEAVARGALARGGVVTLDVQRAADVRAARSRGHDLDIPHQLRLIVDLGGPAAKPGLYADAVRGAAQDLADCVRQPGRLPISGGEEGLAAVRLALAATHSLNEGSTLQLPTKG